MIIENGARLPLQIEGVFDGLCGLVRGVLAFVPNRVGRKPEEALAGVLDGRPVRLIGLAQSEDGVTYTARVGEF